MIFAKGSEWRRWDLHVHTKGTLKEDNFKSENFEEYCVTLFRKALENGIAAIGITDYFRIDNYKNVRQFVNDIDKIADFTDEEKAKIREILLIPNVELRMLPATDSGRMINIHCLFNPDFVDSLDNDFFSSIEHSGGDRSYKMNRKDITALGKSTDPKLNDEEAYLKGLSEFAVSHESLQKLKETNKDFRDNVIITVSNSSVDGASGLQKHFDMFEGTTASALDGVRKAIYKISDCIFSGNPKDAEYFTAQGKDDADTVAMKCGALKPCIHGSDAHTEDKLFKPEQDRYCWIKADLTFNGLRQILYEPLPGERVSIGPTKPDQKDDFKVIKKIKFQDSIDFPQEVIFNPNLCSIIGSRSVGKSALLAYIADAVDFEQSRDKKSKGPGEGFPWEDVDFDYSIEWANGLPNDDSPGKVVYIPQNFLYKMSEKPEEIKNKILPVLTKKLPQIGIKYAKVERDIKGINDDIRKAVEKWFEEKSQIGEINDELEDLGAKEAVQAEKKKTDEEIKLIKDKYKLKTADIKQHQKLSEKVSEYNQRISQIKDELEQIGEEGKKGEYFWKGEISLTPSVGELPDSLQEMLNQKLDELSQEIIGEVNKIVSTYNTEIEKELAETEKKLNTSSNELNILIQKQEKNEALKSLIEKSSELKSTLAEIRSKTKKLTEAKRRLSNLKKDILDLLKQRDKLIKDLKTEIQTIDQSNIKDMSFGIEAEIEGHDFEKLQQKVNTRAKTDFVSAHRLYIEKIRPKPTTFLEAIYSGDQKINQGYDRQMVGIEALTLTERILFTAQMEGDRIGGYSEPTMTPGKRALFALRLMLAESEDTWPLLIDQPEDDLDSRSIFDDIVPFLREKKRERQIIMVSHNANLVIGGDSEQIIVANRHGEDRKNEDGLQFNYLSGSIENKKDFDPKSKDTLKSQGIREHACQILEGGELAFKQRSNRYDINREGKHFN